MRPSRVKRDELKTKYIKLQRLEKLFESIVIEPHSNTLAIKTGEFEHPERDKYRIIVPEQLEQDVIRRFSQISPRSTLCNANYNKQSIKSLLDNNTNCHCNMIHQLMPRI